MAGCLLLNNVVTTRRIRAGAGGGAYAAGMTNALSNATYSPYHPKAGQKIFSESDFGDSYFLAPFEPDQFSAPEATNNKQFSHTNDAVAGANKINNLPSQNFQATEYSTIFGNYSLLGRTIPDFNSSFRDAFKSKGNTKTDVPKNTGGKGDTRSCSVRTLCCFAAGTKVLLADGTEKAIEDVQPGDMVQSMNINTLTLTSDKVREVSSPIHDDIVKIHFNDGTENTNTFDHAYYVKGKGWCSYKPGLTRARYGINAGQLEPGDVVYRMVEGKRTEIAVTEITEQKGEIQTYNVFTETGNSYFANGILVHNETKAEQ